MTSSVASPPTLRGLFDELFLGRVRWDLLRPFPEQDPADRAAGDAAVAAIRELLTARVNPERVDRTGELPDGLTGAMQDGGFYRMLLDRSLGGLELSPLNALRVVSAAASWSPAVAWSLAVGNGFGSGSYLPIIPEGPLRDLITRYVREGIVSGSADTEANGAANHRRHTTAVPVDGGTAYVLNGEKVFTGNGPLARIVDVAATVEMDGVTQVRYFFVDTTSPGFTKVTPHEFMGLKGTPIGVLRMEDVRVPATHLLPSSADESRYAPEIARLATLARTLVISSPALAIAKLCLVWQKDFVNRRVMDDRPLGSYEEVQRIVAETAAEAFTIESVLEWGLLARDRANTEPDLTAAKNTTSLACWRAVERTMSLLGGEGLETARSKARRGAVPLPVERFHRDARGLRVAGGVDFLLDYWSAESALVSCYYEAADAPVTGSLPDVDEVSLSPRCRGHLRHLLAQAEALGSACARLTREHGRDELLRREHVVITLGKIANDLLAMAVVLARAAALAERGDTAALDLADVACSAARVRLAGLWPELDQSAPDHAAVSADLLGGDRFAFLLSDVVTDLPPHEV
ncbi:acyl-CoA dehydrogenase family protein [Saccharothrix syringae]|uniref:Acyl-CoA dehydrogenase n=1 Tax=Saccharothrix syringae TaxID=103733 RepID=A0A5Q0H4I4_SACSY|nr:acyl-CoA dehydrogenase family protein [Saccharothrix syringae]QFZ21136.1 acyl-CoA dehydrogenase [Saccharothrix syringae]